MVMALIACTSAFAESLKPWTAPTGSPKTGQVAHLE